MQLWKILLAKTYFDIQVVNLQNKILITRDNY